MISNLSLLPNSTMDEDLTSAVFSPAQDGTIGFSIHAVWTGTPTGNLLLQSSNDYTDATAWCPVPDSTVATGGVAGAVMYNVTGAYYRYVRLLYDFTSGTGELTLNRNTGGV